MARKPATPATPAAPPAPATPPAPAFATPPAQIDIALLGQIVAATNAGTFMWTNPQQHAAMLGHVPPLVMVNDGMRNPADQTQLATAATDAGKLFVASPQNAGFGAAPGTPAVAPPQQPAPGGPSAISIIKGAALPEVKRGASIGTATYPFETMELGDAFFVPKTPERPTPAKSLASTVSSANIRFAEVVKNPDGTDKMRTTRKNNVVPELKFTRQFVARTVKAGVAYGTFTAPADGALVQRVK